MITAKGLRCFRKTLFLIFLLPMVCIAREFPDYPARKPGECALSDEKEGLKIGIIPVDDAKEQETYFRTKLSPKGLVPVYVVMQNGRTNGSFLFQKAKITFGSGGDASGPHVRSTSGEVMSIVGAGGILGIIGAVKMTHASEVEENLIKKEIQSKTVPPGSEMHGFLYVRAPNGSPREKIHISLPVTDSITNQTITFEFTF